MDVSSLLRGFRGGPGLHTMWKAYVTSEGGLYLKPAADEGACPANAAPSPASNAIPVLPASPSAEMTASTTSDSAVQGTYNMAPSQNTFSPPQQQQDFLPRPPPATDPLYANVLPRQRAQAAAQNPVSLSVGYKQRLERLQAEQEVVRRQLLRALIAERSNPSSTSTAAAHSGSTQSPPEFAAAALATGRGSIESSGAGRRSRNVSASSEKLTQNGPAGTAAAAAASTTTSRAGRALSATRARSQIPLSIAALPQQQDCAHCRQCSRYVPPLPTSASAASVIASSSSGFLVSPQHELRCSCRLPAGGELPLPAGAHLVPLSVEYAFGGSADAGSTDSGNASGGASAPNSNHSHLVS